MTRLIPIERHIRSGVKNGIIPFSNGAAALCYVLDNDSAGLGLFCSAIQVPLAIT
jgi:hypothetical protein